MGITPKLVSAQNFFILPYSRSANDNSADQQPSLIFDHLTPADGLSDGTSLGIAQDHQGLMWFATQNGLDKYDGYQFSVFNHDPDDPTSLSDNTIYSLYLAHNGVLWIGTAKGGLNKMDQTTNTFIHYVHDPVKPTSLASGPVRAIQEDASGNLWIGTENGLDHMDVKNGVFTHYAHDPDDPYSLVGNQVFSLLVDSTNILWVGTSSGLCQLENGRSQFRCYRNDPTDSTTISNNVIYALAQDSNGLIWVGTRAGLNALDKRTGQITRYLHQSEQTGSISNNNVRALYIDQQERLWVGTLNGGLNLFDRATKTFTTFENDPNRPESLSGNGVVSIYEDRSGILWIGTWASNLNFVTKSSHKFSENYAIHEPIAIQALGQQLWIGSLQDGLYEVSRSTGVIKRFQHDDNDPKSLISNQVWVIKPDQTGLLWIATDRGFDRLDPTTGKIEHLSIKGNSVIDLNAVVVRAMFWDSNHKLWIGTEKGIYCIDPETEQLGCYGRDPNAPTQIPGLIRVIVGDNHSQLWIGSNTGLYRLDPETGQMRRYAYEPNNFSSLSTDMVVALEPYTDGTLWIGTWGGGLNHFDPVSGKFTRYHKKDGLASDLILGILKDKADRLWISTSNGLTLFDPARQSYRTYDKGDGLPGTDFDAGASFRGDDGTLYFGSGSSVIAFQPEAIRDNPYLPPVVLTDFQLFNKSIFDRPILSRQNDLTPYQPNYVTDLTLGYDQSVFTFEYAALNFSASAKNQYAYQMENFDSNWNYVGNRRLATYTNLNPGSYTFRVKASNNDGVWNEEGLSIRLTIMPPWWRTWWAYLLYLLVGIGLIFSFIQLRTRAQTRELLIQGQALAHERQIREIMQRVDRSKDEERARIAREMHDGLAQTLAGLHWQVRTWSKLLFTDPKKLSLELEGIGPILDDVLRELRQVIGALRPVWLEEMGLSLSIKQFVASLSQHYPAIIHTKLDDEEAHLSTATQHAAFRIVQELLHNAVRHAGADNIWLTIAVGKDQLEIEVRDDGSGFDLGLLSLRVQQGHWGLANVRERAAALKGWVQIDSTPGQGTTVKAALPIEKSASSVVRS